MNCCVFLHLNTATLIVPSALFYTALMALTRLLLPSLSTPLRANQDKSADPPPPHLFPSSMVVALESLLTYDIDAADRNDTEPGGDAAISVFVPSSSSPTGRSRLSRSLAHTTRPSATLLLNKLPLKPCTKHRLARHLFSTLTSIMQTRIRTRSSFSWSSNC